MGLELEVVVKRETREFLAALTAQVDRLEKLTVKGKEDETEEQDEFSARTANKKETSDFDAEDNDADSDETEEVEVKSTKKKTKKLTSDDVNDAAKARAKRTSIAEVKKFLVKKLGVKSISELDEEDYEKAVKLLKAE